MVNIFVSRFFANNDNNKCNFLEPLPLVRFNFREIIVSIGYKNDNRFFSFFFFFKSNSNNISKRMDRINESFRNEISSLGFCSVQVKDLSKGLND